MKLIRKYANGNYTVILFDNGTKIRSNNLNNLTPSFAESIDVTITTKCNGGCEYCYLNCTENGIHADLANPLFDTIHEGTELALNGNDLSHPGLESFLIKMKSKGVICNITVNQRHLEPNIDKLIDWQNKQLIWGIGVSLTDSSDSRLVENLSKVKNAVLHVIDGLFSKNDIENLKKNNLKLLVLGYKKVGRGLEYYNQHKDVIEANIKYLRENLLANKEWFDDIGFDTLSTTNLDLREQVGEENWALYYMGDEGTYTFYIDAVTKKFAISSMDETQYEWLDSVEDMFAYIRNLTTKLKEIVS